MSTSALPVSIAAPLASLLAGPRRPATVLASLSRAVVLSLDTESGSRIVSLLAPSASGVPNGVRLTTPASGRRYLDLAPGITASVGAQRICVGSLELRPVRSWRTSVPAIRPSRHGLETLAGRLVDADLGIARSRVQLLSASLRAGDPATTVRSLVGLGIGLTPGGDDVISGLMVGLRATGRHVLLQQVRRSVGSRLAERTTAISADLLRLAASGHASLECLALLSALHSCEAGDPGARLLAPAIERMLAIGHTSGADLAIGLLLGLSPHHQAAVCLPSPRRDWSMSK